MDDENNNENNVVPLLPHGNQPLLMMGEEQMEHALDSLTVGIIGDMLKDARRGKDQDLVAAVAVLTMANGEERIVGWNSEYGDGEGSRCVEDTVRTCQKYGLLREGETIKVQLWPVGKIDKAPPQ